MRAIRISGAVVVGALLALMLLFGGTAGAGDYTPPPVTGSPTTVSTGGVGGTTTSGPIPRTGTSSTIPLTSLGVGLVTVGGLVITFARRRRIATIAV